MKLSERVKDYAGKLLGLKRRNVCVQSPFHQGSFNTVKLDSRLLLWYPYVVVVWAVSKVHYLIITTSWMLCSIENGSLDGVIDARGIGQVEFFKDQGKGRVPAADAHARAGEPCKAALRHLGAELGRKASRLWGFMRHNQSPRLVYRLQKQMIERMIYAVPERHLFDGLDVVWQDSS